MRITGGELRGRRLPIPASRHLRPALERVREAIFNIIRERLAGARVLDAYAGTGLLGLESLSRGAARVLFVETHRPTANRLSQVLAEWNLADRGRVLVGDCLRLARVAAAEGPFDLVFVDPPYPKKLVDRSLETLSRYGWLNAEGLAILKQDRHEDFVLPPGLAVDDQRLYGSSKVTFLRTTTKG